MKNIYSLPYKITKILLFVSTFLLTFGILQNFPDIVTIIIGGFAIIMGVIHGTVCNQYEIVNSRIKMIENINSFAKFMEDLSNKIEEEKKQ